MPAHIPHLTKRSRQYVLVVHVALSVAWLGAGAANLVIGIAVISGDGDVTPLAGFALINLIDYAVVIPCAFGALITGTLLSVCTKWGLTRHWWVVSKFVLTVVVIVAATFGIGYWVEDNLERLRAGLAFDHALPVLATGIANLVAFVFMTWLSVLKPWGRTPWASPPRSRARRASE